MFLTLERCDGQDSLFVRGLRSDDTTVRRSIRAANEVLGTPDAPAFGDMRLSIDQSELLRWDYGSQLMPRDYRNPNYRPIFEHVLLVKAALSCVLYLDNQVKEKAFEVAYWLNIRLCISQTQAATANQKGSRSFEERWLASRGFWLVTHVVLPSVLASLRNEEPFGFLTSQNQ